MAAGYAKVFGAERDEFWCDHGTALESFTKLGDSIYFATQDGLCLHVPLSVFTSGAHNLRITQTAACPTTDTVTFGRRGDGGAAAGPACACGSPGGRRAPGLT